VPEAVNLAILSPPGCVDPVNAQQGLPANVNALGPLMTTIPEPPFPPPKGADATALPPPPPPVFAVPLTAP
jgi:hypothetical protein